MLLYLEQKGGTAMANSCLEDFKVINDPNLIKKIELII